MNSSTLSLTSAINGVGGECHARAVLPKEISGIHCIGGWVGPTASLERCGKSRPSGIRSPDRPAHSESLHRLSNPDPHGTNNIKVKYYFLKLSL
jgi:hypothetical protein